MTAPDEHMQLAAWLRNPWQKCDDTPRGPIPEWQAALMFEAANVIECYAKSTSLAQAAVAAAYEAAAQVVLGSNLGLDISDIADDVRALATPDQIAALAASPDTITLPRAEVEALMEEVNAAALAIDYAYGTTDDYGEFDRKYSAFLRKTLATLQERMK